MIVRFILLLCFLPSICFATDRYYDCTSGSDSNDGLSSLAPKLTLPATIGSGDVIYLKSGTTCTTNGNGYLTINGSVELTSYGTGRAVIDGTLANGADSFEKAIKIAAASASTVSIHDVNVTASGVGTAPAGIKLESSGAIALTISDVTITGLGVDDGPCLALNGNGGGVSITDVEVTGCAVGISSTVQNSDLTSEISKSYTIDNLYCHDLDSTSSDIDCITIGNEASVPSFNYKFVIKNSDLSGFAENAFDGFGAREIVFVNNYVHGCTATGCIGAILGNTSDGGAHRILGNIFEHLFSSGNWVCINTRGGDANFISGNLCDATGESGTAGGIVISEPSSSSINNQVIVNNTIVVNNDPCVKNGSSQDSTGNYIANNLCIRTTGVIAFSLDDTSSAYGYNNAVVGSGMTVYSGGTWTGQTGTVTATSITDVVNSSTDYRPKAGSALLNAGYPSAYCRSVGGGKCIGGIDIGAYQDQYTPYGYTLKPKARR